MYEAILGGQRGTGPLHVPLVMPDGSLSGPLELMVRAPAVGSVLQELGSSLRFRTTIPDRLREVVILKIASAFRSEFEWAAHEPIGREAGLTEEEIVQLAEGSFGGADVDERALVSFVDRLIASEEVSDAEYDLAASLSSEADLITLTVLVGYYRLLAQLLEVFDIGAPAGVASRIGSSNRENRGSPNLAD